MAVDGSPGTAGYVGEAVNPAASAVTRRFLDGWIAWNASLLQGPTRASLNYFARTAVWFFWPLWPFVMWAIWRWRGSRREAPVAVPAVMLVPLLLLALLDPVGSEASLLPMVLPMTMLAALALPTIRRSIVALIDWFSVMTFSVVGFAIWAYWIAFMTGFPPRMAQKAQEAVPGFEAPLALVELGLGLFATAAWIGLVLWRISRQPRAFWRPMALSSGGMVLTWLLLMTLWLPAANFRKSYREVVAPTRDILAAETGCVVGYGLDVAQRALLAYYGNARFIRLPRLDGDQPMANPNECRWLLVSDRESVPHDIAALTAGRDADGSVSTPDSPAAASGQEGWTLIWHGQRRVSRGERLFLYAKEGLAMK
jgi:4-amino-4-deoxy-L-arabinose transferase-like glycosyltransferase